MAHIISSGETNGIIPENDFMTINNGGVQIVPDPAAAPGQIIYLDFDGEQTRYRNADLDLEIDDVRVEDSRLTPERIAGIVAELNIRFSGQNVLFTAARPETTAHSTIFVGKTSDFERYGSFAGLAETVDDGNRIKDDNAFVLLDAASADSDIVSTIAHEAGHLLGTLDHGGDGLARYVYAAYTYYYYLNNCSYTGEVTELGLTHFDSGSTVISSSGLELGPDEYVCVGSRYDKATDVSINGHLYVYDGGTVNRSVVNKGFLIVSCGGIVNNTTVNSCGNLNVFSNGVANNTTINSNGILGVGLGNYISCGGTANKITVNFGGYLWVGSSGTATEIIENGGTVSFETGAVLTFIPNTINGLVLSEQEATAHSGTTANNTCLLEYGLFHVFSGGIANDTTVNSCGHLVVSEGGTANNTTVYSGGTISLLSGIANNTTVNSAGWLDIPWGCGILNNTTINSGASLLIPRDAIANNTIVNSGGELFIASGGTALNIKENGGYVGIDDATVTFLANSFSGLTLSDGRVATVHSGTTANNTTINYGGHLTVLSGGIANIITLNSGGQLEVFSGGTANDTEINHGTMFVSSRGGSANRTTVNSDGRLYVFKDGFANSTTVADGRLLVFSGGTANNTEINHGSMYASVDGMANCTTVNSDGQLIVSQSGIANITTVNSGGSLQVSSGGTANNTTINYGGYMCISNEGTASSCTVYAGGSTYLTEGARLEGVTTIGYGGQISFADSDTTVDGTINLLLDSPVFEQTTAFLSNFKSAYSVDLANLTLTVGENIGPSTFFLIDKSEGVTSDITITVTGTDENAGTGVLSYNIDNRIYEPIIIGSKLYSLERKQDGSQQNEGLYLHIVETSPISDAAYEYIARKLAYSDRPASEDGYYTFEVNEDGKKKTYYFKVAKIWDSGFLQGLYSGLDAILLERVDEDHDTLNQAVLACGGTEIGLTKWTDIFSDLLDSGIGYDQFLRNQNSVYSACRNLINQGCTLSITGHSLGGALAQWFAAFSANNYGRISQIEDVVTFNSPGLPALVGDRPITSLTNQAKINRIRHYVNDGDLVSMAGEYYLSNAKESSYELYANRKTCSDSFFGYIAAQHNKTSILLDSWENANGDTIKRDQYLTEVASGSPNSLSQGSFSYLTVHADTNPLESTPELKGTLAAIPNPNGGYWIFNKQYAKMIDIFTYKNKSLADTLVTRSDVEQNRIDTFSTARKYLLDSNLFGPYGKRLKYSMVVVGSDELTTSDGSVVRSLSYNTFQNGLFAFFDFTKQQFIWNNDWATTIDGPDLSLSSNTITIKKTLSEPYDCKQICIRVPIYSGDSNSRYRLTNIVTGSNRVISPSNVIRTNGIDWLFVDNPNAEKEYSFIYSANQSITKEKATLDVGQQNIDKNTDEITLWVSDVDAVGASNTNTRAVVRKTVSVQVKTASNPDGITVELQESDMTGLFRGTVSVSALNLTDEDDHLTIVYEDADNGKGVAETIEKVIDIINSDLQEEILNPPENPVGTAEKVSWEENEADAYVVEYSTDNFEHVVQVTTTEIAVDMPELPAGTYQWRVKTYGGTEWTVGEPIVSEVESATPKVVRSNGDGNDDLFFASPNGTWSDSYYARHVGSVNDWTGTNEIVSANGRGRIQNLFFGSSDPNVLCLTDSENGDAIFVDDSYTELPKEVEKNTARLYRIQEIRAGAGDDIVDMTSRRFEYTGRGLTIRGGDGDDVIWANKGGNMLFGDAGNDRIIGASGNDLISGGTGNDSMHGGGGNDVFTFCDNWGTDTVRQLETGSVTLWFASGDESHWNASTLTYTDGDNSVRVSGVTPDQISLKFGDDGSVLFSVLSEIGAFADFTSQKVFEESGQGLLAGL